MNETHSTYTKSILYDIAFEIQIYNNNIGKALVGTLLGGYIIILNMGKGGFGYGLISYLFATL